MTLPGLWGLAVLEVHPQRPARQHRGHLHASIGAEMGRDVIGAPENKVGQKSAPMRARACAREKAWTKAQRDG
jgi:hypothetical protein